MMFAFDQVGHFLYIMTTASLVEEQELVEVTFSFQLRGVSQRPWAVWLPSRDE